MKVKVSTDFILDIGEAMEDVEHSYTDLVLRQVMLASVANAFEELYQTMLIQVPQILRAEVVHVEEYISD